jgi:hypothetical protein
MRVLINLFILGLIIVGPSISLKAQTAKGLIVVESDGYGKKKQIAIEDAQYRAMETIMFRGVPGTDLNIPLIADDVEAKSKFKKYFDELKAGRYKDFITNTNVTSEFVKKTKGAKNISIQVEINYKALRIDLEQKQLIRKFGY